MHKTTEVNKGKPDSELLADKVGTCKRVIGGEQFRGIYRRKCRRGKTNHEGGDSAQIKRYKNRF